MPCCLVVNDLRTFTIEPSQNKLDKRVVKNVNTDVKAHCDVVLTQLNVQEQ